MSTKAINCISGQKCIADLRNHILTKIFFFLLSYQKPQCSNTRPTVHQHKRQWSFGFSNVANTVKILQPQKKPWAGIHVRGKQRQKHSQGGGGGKLRKVSVSTEAVTDAVWCLSCCTVRYFFLSGSPLLMFFFVSSLDEMLHTCCHDDATAGQRRVDPSGITTARCDRGLSWGCL